MDIREYSPAERGAIKTILNIAAKRRMELFQIPTCDFCHEFKKEKLHLDHIQQVEALYNLAAMRFQMESETTPLIDIHESMNGNTLKIKIYPLLWVMGRQFFGIEKPEKFVTLPPYPEELSLSPEAQDQQD